MLEIGTGIAENGALGVFVGTGVLVGGTSEKEVGEGSRVNVGNRVGVSVTIAKGVAVHVAGSGTGVTVDVGGAFRSIITT